MPRNSYFGVIKSIHFSSFDCGLKVIYEVLLEETTKKTLAIQLKSGVRMLLSDLRWKTQFKRRLELAGLGEWGRNVREERILEIPRGERENLFVF